MKRVLFLILILNSMLTHAGTMVYPMSPDPRLTPGSLCDTPDQYRYPEKIPYCERDVDSASKDAIFDAYRRYLGYSLAGARSDYKIDHFIPLCAGGSNYMNNLWPQHKSIFSITDSLEKTGCEKLSQGLISQKELVNLIIKAKTNLQIVPEIKRYLGSLR